MTALRVDLGETGMKRKKTISQIVSCCLLALLMPAWAYALNLGDINLKSEPGEPLEAEILLSDIKDDEQDSLSVGLADPAGFRWAGIAWSPALSQLRFELRRGADGRDHISIRSDEAVRTPVLHFLMQVTWSRGRLFREYTLETGTEGTGPDDQAEDDMAASAAVSAGGDNWDEVRAAVRDTRNYRVVRNDTLWTIARELRPDTSVSIQQMMLALLHTNPDAFSYDNINWVKADAVLQMPNDFELHALTKPEAFAEVLAQNNFWREARGYATIDAGVYSAPGTVEVDGGLRLVAVSEEDLEGAGAATGPDGLTRADTLVLANEQVEELSLENVELEDKLTEAETIIEDLRRLVELKDDELAALQTQELKEQAEPGPGLPERLDSLYDSTVETLSGPKIKSAMESASNLARDYWYIVLVSLALLLLAGWLLYRKLFARDPQGFTVPAASVRPDFPKVVSVGEADSADEMETEETASTGAEDIEEPDIPGQAAPDGPDAAISGDQEAMDELPEQEEVSDEDQAGAEQEDEDLVQNKLDLARAYLELGDEDNVRSILNEVLTEGNAAQREEARLLLEQADSE